MTKKAMRYEEFIRKLKAGKIAAKNGTCPAKEILRLFQGKWKDEILYCLCMNESIRFGELKKQLAGITNSMLASALKDLEKSGFVERKQFEEIPPRVEYSFTKKGKALLPIFYEMVMWGMEWADR